MIVKHPCSKGSGFSDWGFRVKSGVLSVSGVQLRVQGVVISVVGVGFRVLSAVLSIFGVGFRV